ncbi:MAG: DNA polymerase III subunit alpha, partial [Clostridia bacterium]|nr:DNA polymerase III subunit alpha [Clostridia bacterium]
SEYYLIVWDFVNSAKNNSIAVGPGRGSGAGSLVAYLIGITDVDSIKNKLLFERFLNPERVSMPDFDIDFRDDMREDAIRYVTEKYGKDRVSQIITFGTMAAKMAIRDVGRALGMEYSEVDRVAKMIPQKPGSTIEMAMEGELGQIYAEDRRIRRLVDIARELEGMPRHASVHAAGVLITENSLDSYVPLATSGDSVVAQFDMDTIASLGLLKFDFLAVRYLTVVANAEKEIKLNNPDFDIEKIPDNDEKTYSMISDGDTLGLFQLESGGMRRMLSMMKPKNMSDIILAISIYRPGPMDSIPAYLENRRDPSKINYKIDCLRDILDETYGVIVYQEQVMQICRKVANFSYGKADVVRRAMSKKKADAMEKERADFIRGAKANFIDEAVATELFDEMAGFASYAFNKSHAAAYAVTSYRTAYLKANYPAEYFAALLSAFGENPAYMADAKKRGIRTLPPDVNKSGAGFVKDGKDIRYGFLGIKGIGRALADNIAAEREKAPFESFTDFTDRMAARDINRQQLTALASVGAFDSFGVSRAKTVASCEKALALSEDKDKRARSGQIDIFAMLGDEENASIKFEYENAEDYTQRQIMNLEKEYMGVFISGSLHD